jgi:hypothetical protein
MNKGLAIVLAIAVGVTAPVSAAMAKTKAEKARDAFAFMDRQEFMDGIEEAEGCTARNDFGCADRALARVQELIANDEERRLWNDTSNALGAARDHAEAEREAARRYAEAEAEAARRAREEEEEEERYAAREPSGAEKFNMFMGAMNSALESTAAEYRQRQAIADANNARIAAAQEAMRQRNAAAAAERQAEFQRQQAARQTAYAAQLQAAQQNAAAAQAARAAAAANRQAEAAALQARQAKEREMRIAQQEREARENAQRQMATFVASSREAEARNRTATASNGHGNAIGNDDDDTSRSAGRRSASAGAGGSAGPRDYGPAKAWCQQPRENVFECYGPLQAIKGLGAVDFGENRLQRALDLAGCSAGSGYTPKPGMGGTSFDCGRRLKTDEYRMPLYDPFRGSGRPVKVKFEDCDWSKPGTDVRCN